MNALPLVISCNKCTTQVQKVNNNRKCRGRTSLEIPSAQFFCKSKMALKYKVLIEKQIHIIVHFYSFEVNDTT